MTRSRTRLWSGFSWAAAALCAGMLPSQPTLAAEDPPDLPLEALLQAEVQTASRKTQRLQDVAAAVFVITRGDIETAGVTSLPEALRLAPGLDVARLANNRWAVSARGFNGRFANKLQVLIDGRSLYHPLFSGVLWENEDTLLEDIDRIEVIRGPGAALWGANAVNGVINIITRHARDTRGTLAVVGAGSEERGFVALRHGLPVGDGHVRLWAKAQRRGTAVDAAGQPGNDEWKAARAGLRGDWTLDDSRRFTLSGMVHRTHADDRWDMPALHSPSGSVRTDMQQVATGAHLLARHEWLAVDGSQIVLQAFVDRADLNLVGQVREGRNTADLDFQHRLQLGTAHDLVWGLGYRHSTDHMESGGILQLTPSSRSWRLASAFVQDDITLQPGRWHLVAGARLDHNSNTGAELQPNLRLSWTPSAEQTLWAAYSRAARTPSRAELDAQVDLSVVPAMNGLPATLIRNVPRADRQLAAERVHALDLGYRQRWGAALSLNAAFFHARYEHLRTAHLAGASLQFDPMPHVVQQVQAESAGSAVMQGLELDLEWLPSPGWRVQATYAYEDIRTRATSADPMEQLALDRLAAVVPRHKFGLRSSWQLGAQWQVDGWLRRVGTLPGYAAPGSRVDGYNTLDLRLAWRLKPGVELALVGQNLLQARHAEILSDYLPSQALQLQRAAYVRLKAQF